jgi:hypothetical protein
VTVTGTLDVRQEVVEIGPMLWRLTALRSILYETERYVLAGTFAAARINHSERAGWQAGL